MTIEPLITEPRLEYDQLAAEYYRGERAGMLTAEHEYRRGFEDGVLTALVCVVIGAALVVILEWFFTR